jgi:hypothetical protein
VNIFVEMDKNYSVCSAGSSLDIISLGDDGGSQDVDGIVTSSVSTAHIDIYSILGGERQKPSMIQGLEEYVQSWEIAPFKVTSLNSLYML